MSQAKFLPCLTILISLGCSDANFQQSPLQAGKIASGDSITQPQGTVQNKPDSSAETQSAPEAIVTSTPITPPGSIGGSPSNIVIPPIPVTSAVIPVSIGGASLTCSLKAANGMECQFKVDGVIKDVPYSRAFVVTELGARWTAIQFTKLSAGRYETTLPISERSFGVAVQVDGSNYLATSVGDIERALHNIIRDSNFIETQTLSSSALIPTAPAAPNNAIWVAVSSVDSMLCSTIGYRIFLDNNNTIYLKPSYCVNPPSNLGLKQEVSIQNKHLYQYSARLNTFGSTSTQSLRIYLGNSNSILSFDKASSSWTDFSASQIATADATSFEARVVATSGGVGLAIAAINAFDFGIPPP